MCVSGCVCVRPFGCVNVCVMVHPCVRPLLRSPVGVCVRVVCVSVLRVHLYGCVCVMVCGCSFVCVCACVCVFPCACV